MAKAKDTEAEPTPTEPKAPKVKAPKAPEVPVSQLTLKEQIAVRREELGLEVDESEEE